ncbi:ATP-binding cassette domain-containing protein [Thiocapsa bogorovii]|uniref:ATP-binding cassette domain-containing protein n=1 Tax=Thiocapsa bogorovii TaxID=521689 RepID=UPI001E48B5EB|nr:ATP-binding cassette domain-containing protein [Thiocapsa bogorovii]UHD16758.1 ATP-binding cassette domain-containing protein [Thiocapsa bogorovii]
MSPVIDARGLLKRYGTFTAVEDISFEVAGARCFGLLGPNGAGKTTTLRMILGTTPMSAGRLDVFGLSMPAQGRAIRARTGVVPQTDNLDPDFRVDENLEMHAAYFGIPAQEARNRIPELLEFAALTERRHAKTDTLSGGMKRRLTIARALINRPELVILDEPTTGLDPQARHVIWARLAELKARGTTLLLTTHYMEEAERLCDELVIIDRGRILDQGSPRALIRRHVEPEVIEIRSGDSVAFTVLAERHGCRLERQGSSLYCYGRDTAPLIDFLLRDPELIYLHRPAGLEDVFLRLTGRDLRD